ncbi:glycoside hydrolase family 43 protein [Bifidobacterium eulemuris]|uniref:Glycoside hydrolase family 43 protein n=1 Tax=Bifidobacterium eulemuris TaxID=1765219 RepID=A0A7L9SN74_9BIFI|nr:glycoside hydrolase family 43 protein [Bifidobacterium eulemuris]QOL31801.1 glycoside hydrolase family 43 protein [Bifidobacterium eulemuris]
MTFDESCKPYEAYAWAYFTGDGVGGERICLAVSEGNDALRWRVLNGGMPLFSSRYGTKGLRDPFILRKRDGGFVMMATDLNVASLGGDFGRSQRMGSRYLEIWESPDLVHWSDQRHVLVSPPEAGNTWAPEALWLDEIGLYAVYWASNLYEDGDPRERSTYNRMMVAATADFREFTSAQVWVDVCGGNGHDGFGTIDVTATRVGGVVPPVHQGRAHHDHPAGAQS